MSKSKKAELEINDVGAPPAPIVPLFSNMVDVRTHKDVVLLDFGFIGPNYKDKELIEVTQILRICIPWSTTEFLSEQIVDAIKNHSKSISKRKNSNTLRLDNQKK